MLFPNASQNMRVPKSRLLVADIPMKRRSLRMSRRKRGSDAAMPFSRLSEKKDTKNKVEGVKEKGIGLLIHDSGKPCSDCLAEVRSLGIT